MYGVVGAAAGAGVKMPSQGPRVYGVVGAGAGVKMPSLTKSVAGGTGSGGGAGLRVR